MSTTHAARHACGPLDVKVIADSDTVRGKIMDTLELYNVIWPQPLSPVRIEIREVDNRADLGAGEYLECARMHVDRSLTDEQMLEATFKSGAVAMGNPSSGIWTASIPRSDDDFWTLIDLESLVSLVLTEGWRHAGWIPIHAGAVARNGRCALLCAQSGGGKTSLTVALIRRGWKTLGDDKLLLRLRDDGSPELRALVHTFNLHPRTRSWFPEVGELENLPVYSEWTEKRKVHPEDIWSGTTLTEATPTHLVDISRNKSGEPVSVERMQSGAVLSTFLHQTVVPADRRKAKHILGVVARTAGMLEGISLDLGDDVYAAPDHLTLLEDALS